MATARQLIQNILNIASSGPVPISTRISERQVFYWMNSVRSQIISQALERKDDIMDEWIQTLPKVELELTDKSEATDLPVGCYLLKSTLQLPQTIDTYKDNNILSVTGLDGNPITKSNLFRSKYNKYSKFTGNQPVWYIRNNYLYVINYPGNMLSTVTVVGMFENPEEMNPFLQETADVTWTWDSEYPLSLKMSDQLTNIVIQTKIIPFLKFPIDTTTDDANLTQPQLQNK